MAEVLLVALQTLSSSMDASWEHRQSMTRRMAHPLSMAPMTLASCVSFWRWGLFTPPLSSLASLCKSFEHPADIQYWSTMCSSSLASETVLVRP